MRPNVTLRRALVDPGLLGSALPGKSFGLWRAVLCAAMGEPLEPDEREAFMRVTGGRAPPPARIEEAAFVVGRRGGKDRAAATLISYIAGLCDHSEVLAPGERGVALVIAPDVRQSAVTLGYVSAVFERSPILSQLIAGRTADTLSLSNGIDIEVRGASFRRLRGMTAVAIIATEAAFWYSEEASGNPDSEILAAARPALATTGGPLVIISSPYARKGEVWEIYRRYFGKDGDPLILIAQGASRDFNPSLPQLVIDRAFERDPASAAAEFGGLFRTDVESFLSRETIEAIVETDITVHPPIVGVRYGAFADPSGGSSDSFTLAIAHSETTPQGAVAVLDCLTERRAPFNPQQVTAEIAAVLRSYGLFAVTGDRYAAGWVVGEFARNGIAYQHSMRDRSGIYTEVLPLFTAGRARLLDNRRLVSQLAALERRTGAARDRIDHAPGAHDDLSNAVAGALVAAADNGAHGAIVSPVIVTRGNLAPHLSGAWVDPFADIGGGTPAREWRQ